MKLLCLLVIPIWVFSYPMYSAPLDMPESSVARPPLLAGKDPPFKDSTDLIAQPPEKSEVAEVKVVHREDLNKKILIALVVCSSLLGGILLLLFCFSIYRLNILKKWNTRSDRISDTAKGISLSPILEKFPSLKIGSRKGSVADVEYQLLVVATNNFAESNVIGEGGLGRVYKAHFNDHFHAAVKKIYVGGQAAEREFENEVQCLSRIQNQNIISLLGYCTHGEERFLIYEMMENGSLESMLHGPSRRVQLTWHMRMKIALDVARGLQHLHEHCHPPLIHRDLKSSNILLDSNFNAKISDFGLAVTGGNSSKAKPKLSGTLGYAAPEYLLNGKLTDKSDVYAFGVVLLELLMGRRPVEKVAEAQLQSIVTWATPQLTDRTKLPTIIDQAIRNTMDLKHLYQVAAIAVLCIQPEPSYRPLITDVLHSFIPLVPVELGGSLRVTDSGL